MSRESLVRYLPGIAILLLLGGGFATAAHAPERIASGKPAQPGVVRLSVGEGFAQSRFSPQVLYPVSAAPKPDWLVRAVREARIGPPPRLRGERPVISICIDDLGEDLAGTDKAMALPKEVALSFLPYAETTPFLAQAARRGGHLVLAHVPMQALNGAETGPMGLKPGMSPAEVENRLVWNLARVPGLAGINNHEGSLFTGDARLLAPVMAVLRARHLFFFDSRTSAQSQGSKAAEAAGVMTAQRDVFLDDDPDPELVKAEFDRLVQDAKRNGVAIAIGHPRDVTLKLLAKFLAEDRGVDLVPLDAAMRMKAQREYTTAALPSP